MKTDKTERELELESKVNKYKVEIAAFESVVNRQKSSIQACEHEIRVLESELAQLREQKQGDWKPEKGESYAYVSGHGEVFGEVFDGRYDIEKQKISLGNVFKPGTGEAEHVAENFRNHFNLLKLDAKHLAKIAVQVKIEKLAEKSWGGEVVDWENDSQCKYLKIKIQGLVRNQAVWTYDYGVPVFKTAESRDAAFASLSDEERELYFNN